MQKLIDRYFENHIMDHFMYFEGNLFHRLVHYYLNPEIRWNVPVVIITPSIAAFCATHFTLQMVQADEIQGVMIVLATWFGIFGVVWIALLLVVNFVLSLFKI